MAVRTDEEAAADLTTLLKAIFNGNKTLQQTPLFIFGESYGGKFAVTLGLSVLKAVEAGDLKLQLGGTKLRSSLYLGVVLLLCTTTASNSLFLTCIHKKQRGKPICLTRTNYLIVKVTFS